MPVAACSTGSNPLRLPQGPETRSVECGKVYTNYIRVVPPQTFVVNLNPLGNAGTKIVDNDIRLFYQLLENLATVVALDVQDNAAFPLTDLHGAPAHRPGTKIG